MPEWHSAVMKRITPISQTKDGQSDLSVGAKLDCEMLTVTFEAIITVCLTLLSQSPLPHSLIIISP